ncbi:MAG: hypothetical protein KA436_10885 [Oligoflexales bacterium]|nr:hypothetical protein [Oligoflexales bacterium]
MSSLSSGYTKHLSYSALVICLLASSCRSQSEKSLSTPVMLDQKKTTSELTHFGYQLSDDGLVSIASEKEEDKLYRQASEHIEEWRAFTQKLTKTSTSSEAEISLGVTPRELEYLL